jgi:hypothetical protein
MNELLLLTRSLNPFLIWFPKSERLRTTFCCCYIGESILNVLFIPGSCNSPYNFMLVGLIFVASNITLIVSSGESTFPVYSHSRELMLLVSYIARSHCLMALRIVCRVKSLFVSRFFSRLYPTPRIPNQIQKEKFYKKLF